MKTALLDYVEDVFVGEKPHEASFAIISLDDGSTAPLGRIKRVAVRSKEDAIQWAKDNGIEIIGDK